MNDDLSLIADLKKMVKSACMDFCREYTDCAGNDSSEVILTVLENHLRIIKKLSIWEKTLSAEK